MLLLPAVHTMDNVCLNKALDSLSCETSLGSQEPLIGYAVLMRRWMKCASLSTEGSLPGHCLLSCQPPPTPRGRWRRWRRRRRRRCRCMESVQKPVQKTFWQLLINNMTCQCTRCHRDMCPEAMCLQLKSDFTTHTLWSCCDSLGFSR